MSRNYDDEVKELENRIEKAHEHEVDVLGRRVYLTGDITWDSAVQAMQSLQVLDSRKGIIHLIIVTEGGDVSPGMALFTAIRKCKNLVYGHAWGECSSTGAILMQACHFRKMGKESSMMIHPGRLTMKNRHATDFINFADNAKKDLEMVWRIFYDRMKQSVGTKMSFEHFQNMTTHDKYFNAQEALDIGLIDEIE